MIRKTLTLLFVLALCIAFAHDAEATKHKKRHRRYTGPPPTHPVVLWSRTLSEGKDREQRRVAAFKLSQYSQTIFQSQVIDTLVHCMKDPDVQIKVLCAKAMGHAGTASSAETMRKILLEQYAADPVLRSTIVRTFIIRKDSSPTVHETFLDALKKSENPDETMALLGYFEQFGNGSNKFVDILGDIYRNNSNTKIKRSAVKALSERATGQDAVIAILSDCVDTKDTPLLLQCLSGLQQQSKKDNRSWTAVEKTIQSNDPDVLLATLDAINALPETANPKIAKRLIAIIDDSQDEEIQERAVLALGVCGDQSEEIVAVLQKLIEEEGTVDATRIAAALVYGKQAIKQSEKPREVLTRCSTQGKSQALKTACQLGIQELDARTAPPKKTETGGDTGSKISAVDKKSAGKK